MINGRIYSGWLDVKIEVGLMQLARTFSVGTTRRVADGIADIGIRLGDSVVVKVDGDIVLTGYVTLVDVKYSATSVSISVEGSSKAIDLVECCIPDGKAKSYKNLTPLHLLNNLASNYDIEVLDQIGITDKVSMDVAPDQKIGDAIIQFAKSNSYLVTDNEFGQLILCRPGSEAAAGDSVFYGVNVVAGSLHQASNALYSKYICLGQGTNPDSERPLSDNQLAKSAINSNVRKRVKVYKHSGNAQASQLQKRVNNTMAQAIASSQKLTYEVHGWRQSSGALWKVNSLVRVVDDFLSIKRTLLISKVTYALDSSGMRTTMELMHADAFLNVEAKSSDVAIKLKTTDGRLIAIGSVEGGSWTS